MNRPDHHCVDAKWKWKGCELGLCVCVVHKNLSYVCKNRYTKKIEQFVRWRQLIMWHNPVKWVYEHQNWQSQHELCGSVLLSTKGQLQFEATFFGTTYSFSLLEDQASFFAEMCAGKWGFSPVCFFCRLHILFKAIGREKCYYITA